MAHPGPPGQFFADLRGQLLGRKVSYRRLAADSLLLYIDCEPGDGRGFTLWFEPIWHFRGPEGVLVGSSQVAEASEAEGAMAAVAEPMDLLSGRAIADVLVEAGTFDLSVEFEGGYRVKTFVSDPTARESWHIRENATGARLDGSPRGLAVVPGDVPPR
jgi:hypothetical protein